MNTNTAHFALPAAPSFVSGESPQLRLLIADSRLLMEWVSYSGDGASRDIYFYVLLGLDSKEAYLEFRDALKAWLKLFAATQKDLKARMRRPGGCSTSQMFAAYNTFYISGLIELRRASKVWARGKMEDARKQAA